MTPSNFSGWWEKHNTGVLFSQIFKNKECVWGQDDNVMVHIWSHQFLVDKMNRKLPFCRPR